MRNNVHPFPNVPFPHKTPQQFPHQLILFLKNLSNSLFPRLLSLIKLYQSLQLCIFVYHFPFVHQSWVCWKLETVLIVGKETLNNYLSVFWVFEQVSVDSCQNRNQFCLAQGRYFLFWFCLRRLRLLNLVCFLVFQFLLNFFVSQFQIAVFLSPLSFIFVQVIRFLLKRLLSVFKIIYLSFQLLTLWLKLCQISRRKILIFNNFGFCFC